MHALLLTLIAVAGADGDYSVPATPGACAACSAGSAGGCDACGGGYGGYGYGDYGGHMGVGAKIQQHRIATPPRGCWWGMMPQTCYEPPYGCYPGTRHMNRYPAFHGTYYRNSYNYRNYFDYPWHAEMHEPTSLFSYNTEDSVPTRVPLPAHASHSNTMSRKMVPATQASAGAPRR